MAKKPSTSAKKNARGKSPVTRVTAIRNTPLPRTQTRTTRGARSGHLLTHEMIAQRAYLISISGNGGSQDDNWHRAERELRAGI